MDKEAFKAVYPDISNARLAEMFGITRSAVSNLAARLGLKKSIAYRSEKQRLNSSRRVLKEETKAKIAAKAKGRIVSEETKAKMSEAKRASASTPRGESHYNWKGGRPWERFKDSAYIAWRNAVLDRDGYICQHCDRQCRKHEKGLAAHHLKPYATHPELRLEVSNGITLCRACHMAVHGRAPIPKEKVACACGCGTRIESFDRYGRPRQYVNHHAVRGRPMLEETKRNMSEARKGRRLTAEHRMKISAGCSLNGRWSRNYAACIVCGTTSRAYCGNGKCSRCYHKKDLKSWSRYHDACIECGKTARKHSSKGRCTLCDQRHKKSIDPSKYRTSRTPVA